MRRKEVSTMMDILWLVVLLIAVVLMVGATIMESKKTKNFRTEMKELNKDRLELIYEIEVNMGLRRSK